MNRIATVARGSVDEPLERPKLRLGVDSPTVIPFTDHTDLMTAHLGSVAGNQTKAPVAGHASPDIAALGKDMYDLAERLFPLCRSLTGDGVRETLSLLQEVIPLETHEVPSGTRAFDWEVPPEWNIRDAFIKDETGRRVVDFNDSNLHVVGYSVPFEGRLTLGELDKHLYSLPDQPDLIPYVTSYYSRRWGFCLTHNQRQSLADSSYDVCIDSTLEPGSLTYGELVIKGASDREIFISTYICHPSMANNELSGPLVATYLAKRLLESEHLKYTYRFVFVPETIGSIVYLSRHLKELKDKVIGGYVVTCVGDPGPFSYLQSRGGEELVDRVTRHVLENSGGEYKLYDFLQRCSDERQYCFPGIDLPMGSLMRTKYGEYPEYHTSGDGLSFISPDGLAGSVDMYTRCLELFERNATYRVTVLCEPQLGKRGLYPTLGTKDPGPLVRKMINLLTFCDGKLDLLGVAERIREPAWELFPIVDRLVEHKLLERVA
jgi:aminopeptidase-like protein